MFENLPDLLTLNEARHALQIGKNKMLELLWNGQIEDAFKIGRSWRIPRSSLIAFIRQR